MKRIILAIIFAGSSIISFAQKDVVVTPYSVHIDSVTKLISYEGVVEVKNLPAAVLYKKINDWFHSNYENPAEVIRENDSLTFSIIGKPRFRLQNPPDKDGNKVMGGFVQYKISVKAKDGRFRYELTEYNVKQTSYFPCERWLDTKAPSYSSGYNAYLQQLEKYSLETINSLKNAVAKEKAVKDRDNW
jgi:hypothetical protein